MADERPSAEPDLAGELPPTGELGDVLLPSELEVPPEAERARARRHLVFRAVLLATALFASVWVVLGWPVGASTIPDLLYFFQPADRPIDLGDLRARRGAREEPLEVPSNSYVRLANQVMTFEAESDSYQYFYCPLYDIVTRTRRPLPTAREEYRSAEVPAELQWLVEERRAFAEDLTVGFSGEGRLLRADRAPRYRYIYDAYARTVTAPAAPEKTWIFLDGDVPSSYWAYPAGYALALRLVGLTTAVFVRAVRVYRRVRASV